MGDEPVVIGVDYGRKDSNLGSQVQTRKTHKRKRASLVVEGLSSEQKESVVNELAEEMKGLLGYYKEVMDQKVGFGLGTDLGSIDSSSVNAVVAVLMEESDLPLSRLVEEIHGRVKEKMTSVTLAAVKSAVLFVGHRIMYGVPNEDADVLEDVSSSCLWCWEARELQSMPKPVRQALKIRRTLRKKIHERIFVVSEMITVLKKSGNDHTCQDDLMKASEKLTKVSNEADIRRLENNLSRRSSADMAGKDAKQEEKSLIKQLEKNKKEAEKEQRRRDRKLEKEKLRTEKEQKRLQEATEKDEKRREKEEAETKKQLRKKQEEAEKEQRRREKEEAQIKKQLDIKKQASVMERFLKKSKTSAQTDSISTKPATHNLSSQKSGEVSEAVTSSMDSVLSSNNPVSTDDLRKFHVSSWRSMSHSLHSNRKQCWGMRKKPKTELVKDLKLSANKSPYFGDESGIVEFEDGWGSCGTDANTSATDAKSCRGRKQLLQFAKSYRPAFYGIWPKKSKTVGPRHPWQKDPELEYDVDSDEEWEEEEPGENLSDCDVKDDEEESLEGCSKDDEDESEDGFFVPDGYLSENEGVPVDSMEVDHPLETKHSPGSKQDMQSEEFTTLLRQQKCFNNLTEKALRKNQPLIILNLMHEKASMSTAEDLTDTPKIEQTCLQALSIRGFPGCSPIEISIDNEQDEDLEASSSNIKDSRTPISTAITVPDSDLLIVVSTIQSCSQSIVKVVDCLHEKLPAISKTQLRNKVREVSEFVDNRWQVKKEVLSKLGMSISPEKGGGKTKSIATFFSKRCLPPAHKDINSIGSSSPQLSKDGSASGERRGDVQSNT